MYERVNHPIKPCRVCGKEFKPIRIDSELCSIACKKMETRSRARAWYFAAHEDNILKNRQASVEFRALQPRKQMLNAAKDRAKVKKLDFNIDINDIIIPDICPIFGVKLERKTRHAPSLDRMDASLGYIKGNVWVISKFANTMKNNATLPELKAFGKWARTL